VFIDRPIGDGGSGVVALRVEGDDSAMLAEFLS
jgi:hypothetical protein